MPGSNPTPADLHSGLPTCQRFLVLIEAAGVADVSGCAVGHTGDYWVLMVELEMCSGSEYHSLVSALVYMNFGIIKNFTKLVYYISKSIKLPLSLSLVRV